MSASDVTAVVDSSPELRVSADHSSWSLGDQQAIFQGDVELVRGDVKLTCDRLELHHDSDGAVERAIATGTVRVEREAWQASSDRAELDQNAGQLVLTGSPTLEEESKTLKGERISIALQGDSVSCEKCILSVGAP